MHPGVKIGKPKHPDGSTEEKKKAQATEENAQPLQRHNALPFCGCACQRELHEIRIHALAFFSLASISLREIVRFK